jgi:hypothetical protein
VWRLLRDELFESRQTCVLVPAIVSYTQDFSLLEGSLAAEVTNSYLVASFSMTQLLIYIGVNLSVRLKLSFRALQSLLLLPRYPEDWSSFSHSI